MVASGEREESQSTHFFGDDIHISYHRQIIELLQQILNKLNDIKEELANQPVFMVNEDMIEGTDVSEEEH